MPQIPLFVSSAKAGGTSDGSFDVRFSPALTIPEGATNCTIEIQQAEVPFTTPNVTAANNTLVIALPNHDRTASVAHPGDAAVVQKFNVSLPVALYDLAALELAINRAVNDLVASDTRIGGPFYKVATATHTTVARDGTSAVAVPADVDANWLTFVPDYANNLLNIRLNYPGSAIYFSDAASTLAPMLGFTADVTTDTDKLRILEANGVKLDILWREETSDDWETFAITVPQQASRGYTVAQVKADINNLVKTHLANVESQTGGAYSAMLATLTVRASTDMPGQVMVKSTYTNGQLVCIRGDFTIAGSTAGLSSGILRTGIDTAGYWSDNGRSVSLGNVYADNQAYWLALTRTITKADGTGASTPSDAERRTAALMLAIGASPSGVETNVRDLTATDNVVGIAVQMWVTATTMARSQGATAPAIDSVTSVGVAVEPIVQNCRDTSGRTSGTLARYMIPSGTRVGDVMPFQTVNPVQVSIQQFAGQPIPRLTFRLVDQHNDPITDLQEEAWSAVVLISYDL